MGAGESIQWWGTHFIEIKKKNVQVPNLTEVEKVVVAMLVVLLGFSMLTEMGNLSLWAAEFAGNSPGEVLKAAVFSEGAAVVNKGNFDKVYFFVCFS